jgi:hypothetical protein
MNNSQLDIVVAWVEAKGASYLAAEDLVVYWASDTGKTKDYNWKKFTVEQTLRMIRAHNSVTRLFSSREMLITAFQEVGEVYDYGCKSRDPVREGVFNFMNNKEIDLINRAARELASYLSREGYEAVLYSQVVECLTVLCPDASKGEITDAIIKSFPEEHYVVRRGDYRMLYRDRKVSALAKPGTISADLCKFNLLTAKQVVRSKL